MKGMLEKSKNITWLETAVKIMSAPNNDTMKAIEKMAEELTK